MSASIAPGFDPNAAAAPDSGIFGLSSSADEAKVVLIPVPFEATTSYGGGTSGGPGAILQASRQIDLFDVQTGHPWRAGIAMLPEEEEIRDWNREARALAEPILEAGGLHPDRPELRVAAERVNALGAALNERVRSRTRALLEQGKIVGVVGGDHAVPFGSIQAHAAAFPGLGVLHVDAHADLREAYEGFEWSHASIMANVMDRIPGVSRLVQVGIRDLCQEELERIEGSSGRIVTHFDAVLQARKFEGVTWGKIVREIVAELPSQVYISFDIDGLDPVYCPHTGTPVPGGLSFAEAVALIDAVVRSERRIVGFDLNEVAPGEEGDEWDGNVGARLLYKMIGFALLSQGIGEAPKLPGRR
jgi:agmatinase